MGTGKTTTGRLVAEALGLPMTDSDAYLNERYGHSANQIAETLGPDVLHAREAEHVLDALERTPRVIAAAASVVEDPRVREALRALFVVWLDAPDAVLEQRMRSSSHRPDFDPETLRARREPHYRELADLTVDVAANRPEPAARLILDAVGASKRPRI